MKAVQSYWVSEGDASQPATLRGGWVDARYHLMSWCLSALLLKTHFDRVELVSDEPGAHLLVEVLGLPYTHVSTALDPLKSSFGKMWVLGKLHTYALQNEPFLHVDGDAFLFARPADTLLNAPLIAQNLEHEFPLYGACLQACRTQQIQLPRFIEAMFDEPVAANAGVVGGQNVHFFKRLYAEAHAFLSLNTQAILQATQVHDLPIILEQAFYYGLARQTETPMAFLVERPARKAIYTQMAGFVNVGNPDGPTTYAHMLGYYKQHLFYCKMVEHWLQKLFPAHHERVLQLLQPSPHQPLTTGPPHDESIRPEARLLDYSLQQAVRDPFRRTREVMEQGTAPDGTLGGGTSVVALTPESVPALLETLEQTAIDTPADRHLNLLTDTMRYELYRYRHHQHRLDHLANYQQQETQRHAQFEALFNRPFAHRLHDTVGLASNQRPLVSQWDPFRLYATNSRREAGQFLHQPIIDYRTGYLQEFTHSDFSLFLIHLLAGQPRPLGELVDGFVSRMGRPITDAEHHNLRLKLDTRLREMYLNGDLTYQRAAVPNAAALQPELLP